MIITIRMSDKGIHLYVLFDNYIFHPFSTEDRFMIDPSNTSKFSLTGN